MTEPGADRVDIDTGSKEMTGAGMANRMRTNALCGQSWHSDGYFPGIAFHHRVNAKPGNWPTAPIDKDVLGWRLFSDQRLKFLHGVHPQRAEAQLVALAADLH